MYNRYPSDKIRYAQYPNNRTKIEKKQTKIPFGKILLAIIGILLLVLMIWGIKKITETDEPLPNQEDISKSSNSGIILPQIDQFKSDFQKDINKMLRGFQYSQEFEYSLPKTISKICFGDGKFENMYFVPSDYGGNMLKNIDLEKTLKDSENICFEVYDGKVYLVLKRDYYGSLVTIVEGKYEEPEETFEENNIIYICNGTWEQEYYWEGVYECDGNVSGCNISSCLCGVGFSSDLVGGCNLNDENITQICNGTWQKEYYEENVYECDGNVSGCNISSCLCGVGFSSDLVGGCNLNDENITQICNGTWEQEYYWEGVYECDGNVSGCNISSCLCGVGFSSDLVGGCEEEGDPPKEDPPIIKYDWTNVSISKSSQLAKANMESSLMFSVTDSKERNLDVFFEDVSNIGFEFTGNPGSFEDVRSGRQLLQTVVVPEAAYPGNYKIRIGTIPTSLVSEVKNKNGGTLPLLSVFPDWGFETDEIILKVDGINYEPTIALLVEQDDNIEGSESNPFHPGEILLRINIVEDEGYIASYMPRWGIQKLSGTYCSSSSDFTLFAGNGLGAYLIVPPVSTKVKIRINYIIEDGIFSVSRIRNIYVNPSSGGC